MSVSKMNISGDIQSLPGKEKAEEVTKAFQAFITEPLQTVSGKLEGLVQELESRDDRINSLENRVRELETKVEELSTLLKQIESRPHPVAAEEVIDLTDPVDKAVDTEEPAIDVQELIAQAKAEEQKGIKEDQSSIERCLKISGFWLERGQSLNRKLQEAAGAADDVIAQSNKLLESLPEELAKALESSQQGLNIIGRMLQRLVSQDDRLESLSKPIEMADQIKALDDDAWLKLLDGEKDESSAQKKITKKLDAIRRSNYRLVSNAGEAAEKRQKSLIDFIGKQVLPILDGISDGKNHTSVLIDELKEQHQESESTLKEWFNTYFSLSSTILTMLSDLGVIRMEIEPGMPIDFERHEPSSVEADPAMENEQIKEISREGYEYVDHEENRQTLRVARVVVVKN